MEPPQNPGRFTAFVSGPGFDTYRQQVADRIADLVGYFEGRVGPDEARLARDVRGGFEAMFSNRFDENGAQRYSESARVFFDHYGKHALDHLCRVIVRDGRVRPEDALECLHTLATSVTACGPGAVSALMAASREVDLLAGGVRGELWSAKEATIREIVLDAVQATHGHDPGNETHYFAGAWNAIAPEFGLQPRHDLYAIAPRDPDGIPVAALRERIARELTPDRVALTVADRALELFRRASTHLLPDQAGPGSSGRTWLEFPLEPRPFEAPLAAVRARFGPRMTLNAFVALDEHGMRWRPHTHPMPAAVDVLRSMHEEGLLTHGPERLGHWSADDGWSSLQLWGYGGALLWVTEARRSAGRSSAPQHRLLEPADVGTWLRERDLTEGASGNPIGRIRTDYQEAASDYLLAVGSPRSQGPLFPDLFRSAANAARLLDRMAPDAVERMLDERLEQLARDFPEAERTAFVDGLLDRGAAPDGLLGQWYPDPVELAAQQLDRARPAPFAERGPRVMVALEHGRGIALGQIHDRLGTIPDPVRRIGALIGIAIPVGRLITAFPLPVAAGHVSDALHAAVRGGRVQALPTWFAHVARAARDLPESGGAAGWDVARHGGPQAYDLARHALLLALLGDSGGADDSSSLLGKALILNDADLVRGFAHALAASGFGESLEPVLDDLLHARTNVRSGTDRLAGLTWATRHAQCDALQAHGSMLFELHASGRLADESVFLHLAGSRVGRGGPTAGVCESPLNEALPAGIEAYGRILAQALRQGCLGGDPDAVRERVLDLVCGARGAVHPLASFLAFHDPDTALDAYCALLRSDEVAGALGEPGTRHVLERANPAAAPLIHQALAGASRGATNGMRVLLDSPSLRETFGEHVLAALVEPIASFDGPLAYAPAQGAARQTRAMQLLALLAHPALATLAPETTLQLRRGLPELETDAANPDGTFRPAHGLLHDAVQAMRRQARQ